MPKNFNGVKCESKTPFPILPGGAVCPHVCKLSSAYKFQA